MSEKLSKELEALEKINHTLCLNSHRIEFGVDEDNIDCKNVEEFIECYNIIRKYLKALQIIKEKTTLTKTNDGKKALVFVMLETQQQFDELKEVLSCTMKD